MAKYHFFKAHSRLGMINIPFGGHELNIGVEGGPDAVLTPQFLGTRPVDTYTFPAAASYSRAEYEQLLATSLAEFANLINGNLASDEIQVVVGGDHSVSFSSLLALLQRKPTSRIGVVQFDSHPDVMSFGTTTTGNFHGMYLRALTTDFDSDLLQGLVTHHLDPHYIFYIGNLDPEAEETRFMQEYQIDNITTAQMQQSKSDCAQKLQSFINRCDHIHINFDVDVFDRAVVAATGTPAPAGFNTADVFALLDVVARAKQISIDLVEVNPQKPGAENTVDIAQQVLKRIMDNHVPVSS